MYDQRTVILPEPAPSERSPDPLAGLIGALRLAAVASILVVGTLAVLVARVLPVRVRGARLAGWVVTGMARTAAAVFGVRIRCDQTERLRLHRGFVFPNHLSYADAVVLLALFPVRFLSNHVVERTPFVGRVAKAIGTVFVDRGDRASRAGARRELAGALSVRDHPPLVLFPEGWIGEGRVLHPLRRGAFEVAAAGSVPYLLCAIRYGALDTIRWRRGESFAAALWRLARHRGPLTADLVFLGTVHPSPSDDADLLVRQAEDVLGAAIGADVPACREAYSRGIGSENSVVSTLAGARRPSVRMATEAKAACFRAER